MVTNSLAKSQQKLGMAAYLTQDAVKAQIQKIVGGKNGDRFISSIVSAVQVNPQLQECTNQSILSAALLGQSLDLSPSPQLGQYYMVPFNDKNRGKVATFQLGYKGMIQLAIRSGFYKKINVLPIKEGELIKYDPLEEEIEVKLIEDEIEREKAPTAGFYAMFEYINGFKKSLYWSKQKMESHALQYSAGYKADLKNGTKYTFWAKSFNDMAMKTMLRQLLGRWGIMSISLEKAYVSDQAYVKEDGSIEYVDTDEGNIVIEAETVPAEAPKEQPAEPPKKEPKAKKSAADALFDDDDKPAGK